MDDPKCLHIDWIISSIGYPSRIIANSSLAELRFQLGESISLLDWISHVEYIGRNHPGTLGKNAFRFSADIFL